MPAGLEQSIPTPTTLQYSRKSSTATSDHLLQKIFSEIQSFVSGQQFEMWFSCLRIFSINENSITFIAPNDFVKEWLYGNYKDVLSSAVYKTLNASLEILFLTEGETMRRSSVSSSEDDGIITSYYEITGHDRGSAPRNEYYRFENFIVGPSNRLAHAAAVAVSESPGLAYNPLFIHGASGLGKTHLLHAINNVLVSRHHMNALYLSSEQFVNHFISTIRSNTWDDFRDFYRNLGAILIDDIQFLENLQGCREEFFHTFNALYNTRKQIVIASDCHPESLGSLEDRLISRFKWGLLCSIDCPSLETRVAIIEKKASLLNINLTQEMAHHLAENIPGNIRELEGAIVRLGKELKIKKVAITPELVKNVIWEVSGNKKPVSIEAILSAVSERFNVSVSQIQSKSRSRNLSLPRQTAMYLARKLTNMSLAEIGGFLGGRDHSTVIYADEKITKLMKKDKNILFILQKIESELQI